MLDELLRWWWYWICGGWRRRRRERWGAKLWADHRTGNPAFSCGLLSIGLAMHHVAIVHVGHHYLHDVAFLHAYLVLGDGRVRDDALGKDNSRRCVPITVTVPIPRAAVFSRVTICRRRCVVYSELLREFWTQMIVCCCRGGVEARIGSAAASTARLLS